MKGLIAKSDDLKGMRIVLLHTRLSGYLAACLREFKARTDAEFLIYAWPARSDTPFDASLFGELGEVRNRRDHSDVDIEAAVRAFQSGVILTSGWADKGYLKICRAMRQSGVPVIAGCDTQWTGSLRQRLASWAAPWHIRKAIDVLWVTGERQAVLGRALGYSGDRLWDGYYACNWARFARGGQGAEVGGQGSEAGGRRSEVWVTGEAGAEFGSEVRSPISDLRSLLYVGRYVPEKGLDTLAEAYRRYCDKVDEPWKLICAGAGPLREILVSAGAEDRGFVQPTELPELMHGAAAFLLPSRFEPWGVVVHEAAASGLPLICSNACGAAVHLLRDHVNGYTFPSGDAAALAERMVRMHRLDRDRRDGFGEASFELSKQYTPERWAETLVEGLGRFGVG